MKPIVCKLLCVLLAALTLAGSFACSEKPKAAKDSGETSVETAADTKELTEAERRALVSDELSEFDFQGASFRTIVQDSTLYDIWVEEETGDAMKDSVYRRNTAISERFNVVITEAEAITFGDIKTKVNNTVRSGDDAYDLVLGQMETTGEQAIGGVFLNWYEIPHLDFSKPWYPKSIIENAATVNGKMFSMLSDLCISYAEQTWLMVYDKVAAENYNLPDLYQYVRDGEWTLDRLRQMSGDVYSDTNGDGKNDAGDYHGLTIGLNGCMLVAVYYGFDQRLVTVSDDLEINMDLNCEKAADITAALHDMILNTQGVWNCSDSSNTGILKKFVEGTALFCPMEAQYMYAQLRGYENDYGILPFPKWDAAQEEYYSVCDAGCNVLAVPITAQNTEMIGVMVESLSAYAWKTVLPTYYDIALDAKSTRDEESVEMLDIVLENRVIDFAYLYDGWNGWVFTLPELVSSKKGFASLYASKEPAKLKYYQKVLDFFVES